MEKKELVKYMLIRILTLIIIFQPIYSNSILDNNSKTSFEILNRENGLSNLSVSSIIQDKNGLIWFGTQGGLNRFNGRDITVYRNDPFTDDGLIHNLIQTMYYDEEKHEIWLGTYQGISRLLIEEKRFQHYTVENSGLSDSIVVSIVKDQNDIFWVGTMNGLNRIDSKTNEIKTFEVPGKTIRDIHISSEGTIYLATYQGLCYFDKKSHSVEKVDIELPSPYVMVLKEFKNGILTMGMWDGGTAEFDIKTKEVKLQNYPDNRIYTIGQTADKTLWVGSWGGGLFALRDNEVIEISDIIKNQKYSDTVIYSMLEDNTGILWVGTNGKGVLKLNPRKKDYLLFSNSLEKEKKIKSGKINNIFRDSRDNLWIEVYDQGVNRYNPSIKTMFHYKNIEEDSTSLLADKVSDIFEAHDGKIYLSTGKGISVYDYDTDSFSKLDILPKEMIVYDIKEDKNNNLWIGTYNHGIFYYNIKDKKLINYNKDENKISDNLIYGILIDSKERVWVATNYGLNLFIPNEDRFKTYYKINGKRDTLGSNVTRALLEDSHGNIWIASNGGGLSKFNEIDESFTTYVEKDGLSSNIVTGILEGDNGNLWLSTPNGLSVFNPKTKKFNILTPDDGIGGWEFNSGSFKDKDDTLLFGGSHGITAIPAEFSSKLTIKPKLFITDVKVFHESIISNKEFFNGKKISFLPQENFIEFKFNALDYDAPKKISYQYKLDGFGSNWVDIGTRDYISFTNLAPGQYELLVKARTFKGIESDIERMQIKILSPWYRTQTAFTVYIFLFILLILFTIKARDWFLLNKKNSELSAINKKLEVKNKELMEVSIIDELTGLYNRRYFNAKIEELLTLSRRSKTPLALLMLDLDKFKPINDTYGHLVGDYFLSDIGKLIKESLERNTDFGTRFGGDEFAILLYDTDELGAVTVAEKLRTGIANLDIRNEEEVYDSLHTTVSIGVVSLTPDKDTNVEEIVYKADQALYKAKEGGRNKISVKKN